MDIEEFRKVYDAYHNAPPSPPLEVASKFLRAYFADNSFEEARARLARHISRNTNAVVRELEAIERLLAEPPAEAGTLAHLVAWEANWVLDDSSDSGAAAWLREVAEMIRELMGDKQPPRPESIAAEKSRRDLRV